MYAPSLSVLSTLLLLMLLTGVALALPTLSQDSTATLTRRMTEQSTTSPPDLTVASYILMFTPLLCVIVGCGAGILLACCDNSNRNGNPNARTGSNHTHSPVNSRGQPILTRAELDELFPAISFADFVKNSGKVSEITSCTESPHSTKTATTNNEKLATNKDTTTVVVEPATSELSASPDHHHGFHPSSDNYVCAICQINFGDEESDSARASMIDIDSTPAGLAEFTSDKPKSSTRSGNDLAIDLEKAAAESTNKSVASADGATPRVILIRQLPCKHLFHDGCIVPWLTLRKACCPLCQFNLRENMPLITRTENERSHGSSSNAAESRSHPEMEVDVTAPIARPEPAHVRSGTSELHPSRSIVV